MDLGIKGEVALVVGASEGIGYESAKGLLEEGARVLICSRDADKLKGAAAKLKGAAAKLKQATGAEVEWFAADVTRAALDSLKKSKAGRIVILGAAGARMPYPNQVVSNVHQSSYVTCQSILVDGGIAKGLL